MPVNRYEMFLNELRSIRKKRGLSQGDVAAHIKLSRSQYTAIENGRSVITVAHLQELSGLFKVRFAIGDKDHPLASRIADA